MHQAASQKPNIYDKYILPYIDNAQEGDEILYISPSAFFGFYSLGAGNFIAVCEALERAKKRGVDIRLIIDVHDSFSAKAAEGLLTFLLDRDELRHIEANTGDYRITVYSKPNNTRHIQFLSERTQSLRYLPGIQARPFRAVLGQALEKVPDQDAEAIRAAFYQIWNRSAVPTETIIARYSPFYQSHRSTRFYQTLTYLAALAFGLFVGVVFSLQSPSQQVNLFIILVWLCATIGAGVIASYLANAFFYRRFR